MQVENDSKIQPAFARPDITDVACPFLIGPVRMEVPVQKVRVRDGATEILI